MRIKIILLSVAVVLTSHTVFSQVRSNKDLIGKWNASHLTLEFMPDGRLMFTMRGGSIPGARYRTNFMQIPAVLHIELVQKAQKIVYKSTVEFINNDSFRLTTLNDDPTHAFDKQRSVVLRRQKSGP